jgi:hypothetical protein
MSSVRWFRLAAAQGLAHAQCHLGSAFYHGDSVSVNKVESVKWYKLAAAQGDAEAQFNLGVIYSEGAENGSPDAITFMKSQCE